MKQSTIIAATLVAAFVLFITARGRLPAYVAVLWGPSQNVPDPTAAANQAASNGAFMSSSTQGNPLSSVMTTVAEILPFVGG